MPKSEGYRREEEKVRMLMDFYRDQVTPLFKAVRRLSVASQLCLSSHFDL